MDDQRRKAGRLRADAQRRTKAPATFVALLRAINVGGTGKLPMKELAHLCTRLGFQNIRTYIQSGNVVFQSDLSEKAIRTRLEDALTKKMGRRTDVMVRTASELRSVLKANPFPRAEPSRVGVYFQSARVEQRLLDEVVAPGGEDVRLGRREIYIHFPQGMGRSKLKLPASVGTIRNLNTVTRLVDLAMG
jgi:uncharacterized protein (DUF1697 family)